MVDENLVFHEEWEPEACVDEGPLDARTEQVDLVPFTYQQLDVFKRTSDEVAWDRPCPSAGQAAATPVAQSGCSPHGHFPGQFYPLGSPESLIRRLRCFFLEVTPEDIHKWNVTSLETVKSLLQVSKGCKMDAQVTTCRGQGCEDAGVRLCGPSPKAPPWPPPAGGRPDCPLSDERRPAGQGPSGHAGHFPVSLPVLPQSRAAGLCARPRYLVSPGVCRARWVRCAPSSPPCLPASPGQPGPRTWTHVARSRWKYSIARPTSPSRT